jgi:hypothetical protein
MNATAETIQTISRHIIPAANWENLDAQVQKLAKRAAKLGLEAISLTRVGELTWKEVKEVDEDGEVFTRLYAYQEVEVSGTAPVLNGWHLLATLEHEGEAGTIIRRVPGLDSQTELVAKYGEKGQFCDHCQTFRNRKDTYIVAHEDGRVAQVGSNCIKDFLGHANPHLLAEYAEWVRDLNAAAEGEEEGFSGGGMYSEFSGWKLDAFLTLTAASIREEGWLSRTAARDEMYKTATADKVTRFLTARKPAPRDIIVTTDEDAATAEAALTWGQTEMEDNSEYTHNLKVALKLGVVTWKTSGLVASLVMAYQREMGKLAEREAAAKAPYADGFLGDEGTKIEVTVTVTREITIEGNYGTTHLYLMTAEDGHWLKWFSSNGILDAGQTYRLRGTVKGHDTREGKDSTVLTRCKVA